MRHPDWTSRLRAAVEAAAERLFTYGSHDCCMAVFDLALAMAEIEDPGKPWRGKYKTAAGARKGLARYLRKTGPGRADENLIPMAMMRRFAEIGLETVPVLRAQRGDIVLVDAPTADGTEPALAIVDLTGRGLLAAAPRGWATLPIDAGRMAWRL